MALACLLVGPGELGAGLHGIGHRAAKGSPRRLEEVRGEPEWVERLPVAGVLRQDGLEHAPGVGVRGVGEISSAAPYSMILPAYITAILSAMFATTPNRG